MINKEDKYRNELFELLKGDLETISNDKEILKLIKDIFLSNDNNLNHEEILDKLINNE